MTDTKSPITLFLAPLVIPVTGPMICDAAIAVSDGSRWGVWVGIIRRAPFGR